MRAIAACLAVTLAGIAPTAADELRCPPAGTRITLASGTVITYLAPSPAAPILCPWNSGRRTGAGLYDLFGNTDEGRRLAQGVATAFAGGKASTRSGSPFNQEWENTFEPVGLEQVTVGDQTRDAVHVRWEQRGLPPNFSAFAVDYWIDARLHVPLRRRYTAIRGIPPPDSLTRPFDLAGIRAP